jgi:hypothetical protein
MAIPNLQIVSDLSDLLKLSDAETMTPYYRQRACTAFCNRACRMGPIAPAANGRHGAIARASIPVLTMSDSRRSRTLRPDADAKQQASSSGFNAPNGTRHVSKANALN